MTDEQHEQLHDERDDQAIAIARRHLSIVANGLVARFGSEAAAATLAGALVGVVSEAHDKDAAVRWFRELAAEVERGDEPEHVGHA